MNKLNIERLEWFQELYTDVKSFAEDGHDDSEDRSKQMQDELVTVSDQISGLLQSLSKKDLDPRVRSTLEEEMSKSINRQREIQEILTGDEQRRTALAEVVKPAEVADSLNRLYEVLDTANMARCNIELSCHIDRIDCFPDKTVKLRTCRLGPLADAVDLLSKDTDESEESSTAVKPRRRRRLHVESRPGEDMRTTAEWATDPHRFCGLDERWFEETIFTIPESTSWVKQNAELVFRRRQEAELSYGKLAEEFGVSTPTIRNAVKHYLNTHPNEKDQVNLPAGGQRPPMFDLSAIGPEARKLWEQDVSKLKIAERLGCSSPTVDKALQWAYESTGEKMPTRLEREQNWVASARKLYEQDKSLEEIATELGMSDVTARKWLQRSFQNEGKPIPDMRRNKSSRSSKGNP